ncbi:unnamed protein product [Closterium sp. Naga37s-1]|nr:unnamed protein product [Closterium sp. Naga37s-1]
MGLHRYLSLSIFLLVVTASIAILAARLNGSEVVGATGNFNATGRACLAVFQLDGDYNVFYSVVASASDAGEPLGASISLGAAGEAGDASALLVEAGKTVTWTNLTRPPPPPPKGKKNKGTPPPPPPPKYTYATNGTWLTASTMATIGGQTLKVLVDAMLANPDGYYASFATTGYDSGAARGQFKSDPLPPPPKDKKGGKDGGKKGGKDGGKNGGGKNGGDKFGNLVGKPIIKGDFRAHSCLAYSCLAYSGLAYSGLAYSCLAHSCLAHSCLAHSCLAHSCLAHSCLAHSCLAHSCLAHSCLAHSCLAHSCLPHSCLPLATIYACLGIKHPPCPLRCPIIPIRPPNLRSVHFSPQFTSLPLSAPLCPSLPPYYNIHYHVRVSLKNLLPLLAPPCPALPLPAPPCPSLPLLTTYPRSNVTATNYDFAYHPPNTRPSLPLFATHPSPPRSNATTNDYDIYYHVRVSLNDSGEPTGVVIKTGADVALTVLTSDATWTNRTLSNAERAKLGGKLTPKGRKGKQPPPPLPPPVGYNYETTGTWLSASTLTADNGQTYKQLVDAMLAAPGSFSALVYTKTFEAGAASGAFENVTLVDGEGSGKLAIKFRYGQSADTSSTTKRGSP